MSTRAAIVRYFDETVPYYRVFWHGGAGALHFGMRGPGVTRHRDELLNANRVLADAASIRSGERVLDAGCGVGGSAIWLARERGARVLGLTLSPEQVLVGTEAARLAGVAECVELRVADYTESQLPDASVDVVWAHESACYAADKRALVAEAARILRPGGRVVVADGFRARAPRLGERALCRAFERGLELPPLAPIDSLLSDLRECGFVVALSESRLRDVTPSSRRLFWRCLLSYPLALLGWAIGRVPKALLANSLSGVSLYPMVVLGVVDYCLVVAVKAHDSSDPRATPHSPSALPSSNARIRL
ncbi:MAG: methyltransferase domain-containing protein [Myxococcota bacterium]